MTNELDRLLTDALRAEARAAPMPEGLLRVPDRWVRGRATRRAFSRTAAALGVVATAAIGTAVVIGLVNGSRPGPISIGNPGDDAALEIRNLDTEPRVLSWTDPAWPAMAGPAVNVARGSADRRGFSFTVFRSPVAGVACVAFRWGSADPPSCGYMLPGTTPYSELFGSGVSSSGSPLPHAMHGLVASHVAAVRIETSTGGWAAAELVDLEPAGIDAQLFFVFLPGGADGVAWVATDAAGGELERFDTLVASHPPATPGLEPTPMPTPAQGQRTWITITGPRDWFAPEPLSLEIGPLAWHTDSGGGVSVDLVEPAEVRLFGRDTCRTFASISIDPGTAHIIRFDASGGAAIEAWTGRAVDAGPALVQGELSGCTSP